MWRHNWFRILVGLQILNFAAMALLEQQRRTIWDKEATNAQKVLDTRYFADKTEADFRYVARLLEDVASRLQALQKQGDNHAEVLRDTRERVLLIEAAMQKLPDKP